MKTYKDIKIGCYAIAAGEPEKFIDRWLDSMNGADYIIVFITKENDPNYNYFLNKQQLPQFKNKLIVGQGQISPWRFDVARNEGMKLIPEDKIDVLVCTDIDEIMIPDFWDDLRTVVAEYPDFERIYYKYAWSHNDDGSNGRVFWYDKIHGPKGWKWEYPVHETLTCPNKNQYGYKNKYYLNQDKVYLHHYPDQTKSRKSYLNLLELRVKENPSDLYGAYYLVREYGFNAMWDKGLDVGFQLYRECLSRNQYGQYAKYDLLPSIANQLGNYCNKLKMNNEADFFYKRAIEFNPSLRDSYMDYAQFLVWNGRYGEADQILNDGLEKSQRVYDWREADCNWTWRPLQIEADILCWRGHYTEALQKFQEAQTYLNGVNDTQEALRHGFYGDYEWLRKKLGIQ